MRHIVRRITLLVAALMLIAVPILAEEGVVSPWTTPAQQAEPAQQRGRDECLLIAMDCGGRQDSYQNRIDRIQNEIKKGTAVYTNEELGILQKKLDDANKALNDAVKGGA